MYRGYLMLSLISQLAEQAKQLGIHIDLNYSFLKRDE
jgi:hypothetical protein